MKKKTENAFVAVKILRGVKEVRDRKAVGGQAEVKDQKGKKEAMVQKEKEQKAVKDPKGKRVATKDPKVVKAPAEVEEVMVLMGIMIQTAGAGSM
jgi:hypothetical protein